MGHLAPSPEILIYLDGDGTPVIGILCVVCFFFFFKCFLADSWLVTTVMQCGYFLLFDVASWVSPQLADIAHFAFPAGARGTVL